MLLAAPGDLCTDTRRATCLLCALLRPLSFSSALAETGSPCVLPHSPTPSLCPTLLEKTSGEPCLCQTKLGVF